MGRAGWLLPLLWCLALGVVRAGTVAETTDEGSLSASSHTWASSIGPTTGIHLHLTSPPSTDTPTDAGTPSLTTGRPAVEGPEEAVLGTQGPVSQAESGSRFSITVNISHDDTAAEGQQNLTVVSNLTPTPEEVSPDLNITVEEVPPTQSHSPITPGKETETMYDQSTPETYLLTTPGPTSPQGNLTGETTQDAVDSGETTQHPVPSRSTATEWATSIRSTTATQSIASKAATSVPTSAQTSVNKVAPAEGKQEPSVLDVGDDGKDVPGVTNRVFSNTDPLVVAVISVFIVMIGILGLVGFLRYRQRNNRTEFRRLQDLPMDDMMEDTPLSLYSY